MKQLMICVLAILLLLIGFIKDPLMAQGKGGMRPFSEECNSVYGKSTAEKRRADVAKPRYLDMNDYYYLNDGTVASFVRQENTYLLIHDRNRVSSQALSQSIEAQFGEQLEVVKEHSLGNYVMIRFKNEDRIDTIMSRIYQSDPAISYISPVLKSGQTGGIAAVQPEIVVKIAEDEDPQQALASLRGMNLSLVSKLAFTDTEFRLEIDEPIHDIGRIFEITRAVAELPTIEWAEPNFLTAIQKTFTPNDTLYNQQWHLNNTGQNDAVVDADVDAPEGWDISRGGGTVIAVYDDGVQVSHPDLPIWSNPGETGGGKKSNGVDDDGNGFVDDYQGWDFEDNDNDPSPASADDDHGTAVAGVAGAKGNNSLGVTGSATDAVILPVRMTLGFCTDFADAMRYAGKYADVVNNSWSTGSCQSQLNSAISDVVSGNIADARRGTRGAPVLFATGNKASGWRKFTLSEIPDGSHDYHWRFEKDGVGFQGYDTVWLDNITWPDGTAADFEGDTVGNVPSGFTSDGDATWSVVSDGTHARGASGKSVKAGAIGDTQATNLYRTYSHSGTGTLTYWAWVSCEFYYDRFGFYMDGVLYHYYSPGQYGEHKNDVDYPASITDTIAVGASTDGAPGLVEERSHYSQFGPELDVVACSSGGGQSITTTDRTGTDGYESGDYTSGFGGTSSATPLVAGIVADILGVYPDLTAAQVRQILWGGAGRIGPYAYTSGRNDYYGYGRVNLYYSLREAEGGGDMIPVNVLLLGD